jgi:hypothetical protein
MLRVCRTGCGDEDKKESERFGAHGGPCRDLATIGRCQQRAWGEGRTTPLKVGGPSLVPLIAADREECGGWLETR